MDEYIDRPYMDDEIIEEVIVALKEQSDDELAERRYQIKGELAELEGQVSALKDEREEIDEEFKRRFNERGSTSTKTTRSRISLRRDIAYPMLADATAFEDYVLENKAIHFLQKRINLSAINEELAAMKQEREAYLKLLEDNNWSKETCYQVLGEINITSSVIKPIIQDLSEEVLRSVVEAELTNKFSIPGIELITKETINQRNN